MKRKFLLVITGNSSDERQRQDRLLVQPACIQRSRVPLKFDREALNLGGNKIIGVSRFPRGLHYETRGQVPIDTRVKRSLRLRPAW